MSTNPIRVPVGDMPSSTPGTEEAFITANAATDANAPSALYLKDNAGTTVNLTANILVIDTSAAVPESLWPPTGKFYLAYDENTTSIGFIDRTGAFTPTQGGPGTFTNLTVTGNTSIGNAPTDTLGFFGQTRVARRQVSDTALTPPSLTGSDTLSLSALNTYLSDLSGVVGELRTALGNATGYGLVTVS